MFNVITVSTELWLASVEQLAAKAKEKSVSDRPRQGRLHCTATKLLLWTKEISLANSKQNKK